MAAHDPNLLVDAAFRGDLGRIDQLLREGADIDAEGENWNPLHAAIESSQPDAVRLLLERGANPNFPVHGWSPLGHALELEWDVASNRTPFVPPEPEVSAILIEHGADPNARVPDHGTLLQWVSRLDYPKAVTLLAAAGAR